MGGGRDGANRVSGKWGYAGRKWVWLRAIAREQNSYEPQRGDQKLQGCFGRRNFFWVEEATFEAAIFLPNLSSLGDPS
jgi:hypothetical protein